MPYDVVYAAALEWREREPLFGQQPRRHASITESARLTQSRAQMWRYPAHTRGRREVDKEHFVREGKAHAALVVDGDVAVAWCQYGAPDQRPSIYHLKEYI